MKEQRRTLWRTGIAGLVIAAGAVAWVLYNGGSQSVAGAEAALAQVSLPELVAQALQADATASEPAIAELRRRGPESVNYLMGHPRQHGQADPGHAARWSAVLDKVAQQKDAKYSGLYWYTDLEQALAVARQEKKPVLSLRLLGNLTDELSCANSRFFRTTLYPNPKVRELLASRFVLHWQSVRAVPIITIDFGDGRQIKRTITGNSLHMVLDEQGRPVDVLPGLYAAGPFFRELQLIAPFAIAAGSLDQAPFIASRAAFHRDRVAAMRQVWDGMCSQATGSTPLSMGVDHPSEIWAKLAATRPAEAVLDGPAQFAVTQRAAPEPPRAKDAGMIAITKMRVETPMMRLVQNVTDDISLDSLRNEYFLHSQIHHWFANGQPIQQRDQLVEQVYSQLFLSPLNDPWYGLSKPDVYSALENDGRINAVAQNAGH